MSTKKGGGSQDREHVELRYVVASSSQISYAFNLAYPLQKFIQCCYT